MNYAIEQINEDIVVLENIVTGEKIKVNKDKLPFNIQEGNIITLKDEKYILNTEEENIRRERIAEKLNRLKELKSKE